MKLSHKHRQQMDFGLHLTKEWNLTESVSIK